MEEDEEVAQPVTTPTDPPADAAPGEPEKEFDFLDPEATHPRIQAQEQFLRERGMPTFKVPATVIDDMSEEQLQLYHGMRRSYTQAQQANAQVRRDLEAAQADMRKQQINFRRETARLHGKLGESSTLPAPADLGAEPDPDKDARAWISWHAKKAANEAATAILGAFSGKLKETSDTEQAALQHEIDTEAFEVVKAGRVAWFETQQKAHDAAVIERVAILFTDEFEGRVSLDRCLQIVLYEQAKEQGESESSARAAAASATIRPSGGPRDRAPVRAIPPPPANSSIEDKQAYFRQYPEAAEKYQFE